MEHVQLTQDRCEMLDTQQLKTVRTIQMERVGLEGKMAVEVVGVEWKESEKAVEVLEKGRVRLTTEMPRELSAGMGDIEGNQQWNGTRHGLNVFHKKQSPSFPGRISRKYDLPPTLVVDVPVFDFEFI